MTFNNAPSSQHEPGGLSDAVPTLASPHAATDEAGTQDRVRHHLSLFRIGFNAVLLAVVTITFVSGVSGADPGVSSGE